MRKYLCFTLLLAVTGTVAISALAAVPAVALAATTYYVSPSGSDSNNGTSPSTPWQTIAKVNSVTLTAGQNVLFNGGQTFSAASAPLAPVGTGTSGSPITIGSYGTGNAIIAGLPANYPGQNGPENWMIYQNLTFDGGEADASGDTGIGAVQTYSGSASSNITYNNDIFQHAGYGLNLAVCTVAGETGCSPSRNGDSNWTIQNSLIQHVDESGIVIGGYHKPGYTGSIIQNNQIEHTGTDDPGVTGSDAHGIYDNAPGIQILNNDIGDFQTDGISVRMGGAVIEGNTVHDSHRPSCCGDGIGYYNYSDTETGGSSTETVAYNRIWDVPYGIQITTNNGAGAVVSSPANWKIFNNTFFGSTAGSGIDRRRHPVSAGAADVADHPEQHLLRSVLRRRADEHG